MKCLIKRLRKFRLLPLSLVILAMVSGGCGPKKAPPQQVYQEVERAPEPKLITEIRTAEDETATYVRIFGSRLLTYTSVKQPSPLGVVLYFPETALGPVENIQQLDNMTIKAIKASQLTTAGQTVRVEISLNQDVTYSVDRDGNGL
ncbi:MAG: AMIN domain-containing protein [Deltaproteobacteria bacterium]|nr:AMIN domain-containing protein [Deltaproteobacteria bacterium]